MVTSDSKAKDIFQGPKLDTARKEAGDRREVMEVVCVCEKKGEKNTSGKHYVKRKKKNEIPVVQNCLT